MNEEKIIKELFKKYGISAKDPIVYFSALVGRVADGGDLRKKEAAQAMTILMSGLASEVQIAAFLTAMHMKGETVDEIAAAATVMRACAASVVSKKNAAAWKRQHLMDVVGTGGGTVSTFNISTATAFVLAAAGLTVAKHGNRAITSRAGAADVFESLGLDLGLSPQQVGHCILEPGIGFLFAPTFHQATRHVQKVRRQLTHKTFFNILGPLTNPTSPQYNLVGVYAPQLTTIFAHVYKQLKVKRAVVVHGLSRRKGECLDEVSLLGPTKISELKNGAIRNYTITPKQFGFSVCEAKDIRGGTPAQNAKLLRRILSGKETGPKRDIVVLNAAVGLYAAGKAQTIKNGVAMATSLIAQGLPEAKIDELIEFSKAVS